MKRGPLLLLLLVALGGGYAFFGGAGKSPTASEPNDNAGRYRNCIQMAEYYERAARESRDRKHIQQALQRAAELRAEAASLPQ